MVLSGHPSEIRAGGPAAGRPSHPRNPHPFSWGHPQSVVAEKWPGNGRVGHPQKPHAFTGGRTSLEEPST